MASYKKISVVSEFWPPSFVGGGEISTSIICHELAERGYEITIMTPNVPAKENKHFKFIQLYNPSKLLIPFEKIYFARIHPNENELASVYWASDYYGAAYLSTKSVKKIVTVRDHWPICNNSLNLLEDYSACDGCNIKNITKHFGMKDAGLYKKISRTCSTLYNRQFRKSILSSFNHVVFVSNYIADKITASVPIANYSTIYNPLARDHIINYIHNIQFNKNILFSGFVKEFKGVYVLLKALKELVRVDQKYNLTVVGYGDLEKYINISERMGIGKYVKFVGKLSMQEIIREYSTSTIVVVPSLCFETFSRTVIEGMIQGCIVIASDRGGPAEIIHNTNNGYLFNVGDHVQLARIIKSLYNNPPNMRKVQESANKYAISNFSPEKITNEYELVLKDLS